jgi:Mg2+-importing ATPase
VRQGSPRAVAATELVPGDLVRIGLGTIVPADLRLVETSGLQCDESILTGESATAVKSVHETTSDQFTSCAYMGTVVHAGNGLGLVVATGARTEFGRIALSLGERHPETEFQIGLRRFSGFLLKVAIALTAGIFAVNLVLHRPLIDALLFSLAIAVGITPQLLPAIVTTSLAVGSRRLAVLKVLVKRLVCIEDLGDVEVLYTDKTGTLTEGRIQFREALDPQGVPSRRCLSLGLVCGSDDNALDSVLRESTGASTTGWQRLASLPFDHERLMSSVLALDSDGRRVLVTKGAPEIVLAKCVDVPEQSHEIVREQFAAGSRVVAVASRIAPDLDAVGPADEHSLHLEGFLVFLDAPKVGAADAIARLSGLGIQVKVLTGDNPVVARRVCEELGLSVTGVLTGADLERMDEAQLDAALPSTTIFGRVTPEQKARIVVAERRTGVDVAFLGDGVNDAVALHHADIGISVDTATDVAKDAADVILLEKDLGVLADGVVEGRRIFANTVKYVLMGTSSNFGNMFSAAAASSFLPFLPMLPSQILLNNLLYDSSQLAIPTDRVDEETLRRPARWDMGLVKRFMLVFGPASSVFDFATFFLLLGVLHADAGLFRSGWFVESLATQTLVIFAIRTRRVPFLRSRPSGALVASALVCVAIGVVLPMSPLAGVLGFAPLPPLYFVLLGVMVVLYFGLVELTKTWLFSRPGRPHEPKRVRQAGYRVHRRAARFTHHGPLRTE